MSAILIARLEKREVGRIHLDQPEIVIGRSKQTDLVLDHEDVSRRHAVITLDDDGYTLSDPGSRNGLAVNGVLLQSPRLLADNDEITVGPFTIVFHADSPPGEAQSAVDDDDAATRFISQKDLKKSLPGKPVDTLSGNDPIRVKAELLDGPLKDAKFENWSGDLTIGRGLDNHVVLVDDAVSIYHARIYRQGDDFHLEDLGSSNGTFLRGVRCTNQKLRNKDRIRIGVTTIAFTRTDIRQQKKIRKASMIGGAVTLLLILLIALLSPDDAAETAAERGHALYNRGQYEQARTAFEEALRADRENEAARRGMTLLQRRADRLRTLAEATAAMEEGRYDRAVELCDIVIKNYAAADARDARSLKDAVKVFQEAMIAYDAANWPDAVRILRELTTDYPQIQTIKQRLSVAEAEHDALQALGKARDAASRLQTEIAQNFIRVIPATSRYFIEAGELNGALNWLKHLNELLQSDRVDDLHQAATALGSETHPLRPTGVDPSSLHEKVLNRLGVIADEFVEIAAGHLNEDRRQLAYTAYRDALAAHPDHTEAKAGIERIRGLVRADSLRLVQQARRQESLGQNQRAIEIYQAIVAASIEGDEFNLAAKRRIEELSR